MPDYPTVVGCLVLYKQSAALVTAVSDKIEIQLAGGKHKRVRAKDIALLHPGPLNDLSELRQPDVDIKEAWELLGEEMSDVKELAELIYGEYTPASAWATWAKVAEGLYFEGDPQRIQGRTRSEIDADIAEREAKAAAERDWNDLLERLRSRNLTPQDNQRLAEVEQLAFGQTEYSRILAALAYPENPVSAHRMLVSVGHWPDSYNPHPRRLSLPQEDPRLECPGLPQEARVDLTHLESFAIDDEQSNDPDDAISLEEGRIWVHVADVAALVPPDSALDLEARARAANLYLPEGITYMLPPAATAALGLGLTDPSPALSFGFRLSEDARPVDLQILPSWIRVTRKSYAEAERLMEMRPFLELKRLADLYRMRRIGDGAIELALPEVNIRVSESGEILIRPLQPLASRALITELMLMTGEAVARYALEQGIAIPFATQPAPENPQQSDDMAARYAFRRQMKPSKANIQQAPHAGLGLAAYARATSPLRRYLDLVVHQQLRALLNGGTPMSEAAIAERIASAELAAARVRRAERLSNLHWKLLYLNQKHKWKGFGAVVEIQDQRVTVLIPELALEARIRYPGAVDLNQELKLALREVDVPDQVARFRVLS
ncbi:MAG: RNB domain-containing ribonuclease [Gammaproteobacteria bacterium]|nr:RNB domain-containing ribonuclease [Gammaproteobacteria bacterium]MCB1873258.1 RNB domain-containing ribonuclease [Gammaproteobacteria bacterium]